MKGIDLRSQIIPTKIHNTDENQEKGSKAFNTEDLIYLDSYEEQFNGKLSYADRRMSSTDYAKMNYAFTYDNYTSRTGKKTSPVWLRSAYGRYSVDSVYGDGDYYYELTRHRDVGLCPSLHYNLPSNISARSALGFLNGRENQTDSTDFEFDIREVKDEFGKVIYHTLHIGEYLGTKVNEELLNTLELLYNKGNINQELTATGLLYTGNGQKEDYKDFAGKYSPQFEYQAKRYARVVSNPYSNDVMYSDGTFSGKAGTIKWVNVEPISFVIRNWDEMPKSINPNGNGKAKYFDLRAEEAIIANIPFYPNEDDENSTMWQNSTVRGFFNGIDVRNITTNGNPKFTATRGGNFTGECNFLNEAFNLAREPIVEFEIPKSETEIPDDAFNGCVAINKITLHSGVKSIGKRAFDGLSFKYAYRLKSGELVFNRQLPKEQEKYAEIIELGKLTKSLIGFDYNILLQAEKLDDIYKLSETLSRNKFSIPYVYRK